MAKTRRLFLRQSAYATAAAVTTPWLATQSAFATSPPVFSDYKALVYILLEGGNDAANMVLPVVHQSNVNAPDYPSSYNSYHASRGSTLAVSDNNLTDVLASKVDSNNQLDFTTGNPYPDGTDEVPSYRSGYYHTNKGVAVNAVMPELAHMMNQGKVATVASVGTLIEPLLDELNNPIPNARKPGFLGSHNTQKKLIAMGRADTLVDYGWIGKLFDQWNAAGNINGSDVMAQNISFSGNNHALLGKISAPLVLRTDPLGYFEEMTTAERTSRAAIAAQSVPDRPFEDFYNRIVGRSFILDGQLADIWESAPSFSSTNAYGDPLFSEPGRATLGVNYDLNNHLFRQLSAVLKVLKYSDAHGFKRQVFFVRFGGFDTHSDGTAANTVRLRELSMALYDFQHALEELGLADKVTTFTTSDFGRSIASNGDGTDHAWASHNLVVGNAVNGGLYGDFPDFRRNGPQDNARNGTIIPKIAVEQQFATLAKWFGVEDSNLMDSVFPNLGNFQTTRYGRNVGFMQT